MRRAAARFTVGATTWLAIAAAAFFLIRSEQYISHISAALRAFDLRARETADALAEVRIAQQAYVAAGQDVAFWAPKVAATTKTVRHSLVSLRQAAFSAPARAALMQAEAAIADFETIDKRARDYVKSSEQLMAADVIFTEGGERAGEAAGQVEAARAVEHQTVDATAAVMRKREAIALAAAAGLTALIVLALVPIRRGENVEEEPILETSEQPPVEAHASLSARTTGTLRRAAEICTDFARVRDVDDLKRLLSRAADVMDASGLVVWLGSASGSELRPVLAHGYAPHVVARMPTVPRSADNAAARAYRTATLQIVVSRPGESSGALVAPLVGPDACIGALSAEIRGGSEGSESAQALIAIFAAHLAGVFAASVSDAAVPQSAAQR
jgi:hypothetical protein